MRWMKLQLLRCESLLRGMFANPRRITRIDGIAKPSSRCIQRPALEKQKKIHPVPLVEADMHIVAFWLFQRRLTRRSRLSQKGGRSSGSGFFGAARQTPPSLCLSMLCNCLEGHVCITSAQGKVVFRPTKPRRLARTLSSLYRAGFAVIMPRVGRVLRLTVLLRGALQCEIEHAAIVQSPLFTSATSFNKEWCT